MIYIYFLLFVDFLNAILSILHVFISQFPDDGITLIPKLVEIKCVFLNAEMSDLSESDNLPLPALYYSKKMRKNN